jgi:hypothetical protein
METNKPAHTPEPWVQDENRFGTPIILGAQIGKEKNELVCVLSMQECKDIMKMARIKANAARIVACVNYCKGANNEELEKTTLLKSKSQSQKLVRALNDLVTCVRIFQLKNNQSLDWEEFKYAESVLSDCQELDKNARDFFEDENQLESQRNELLAALKEARGYIQGMLGRKRSTFLDEIDAKIRNAEKGVGE